MAAMTGRIRSTFPNFLSFLFKSRTRPAANAVLRFFCSVHAAPARNLLGPEPSQGCVSGPDGDVRLSFSIFNRTRWGFSLPGGLT